MGKSRNNGIRNQEAVRMCPIGQWENAEPGVTRKILNPGQSLMMMGCQARSRRLGKERAARRVHAAAGGSAYAIIAPLQQYIN